MLAKEIFYYTLFAITVTATCTQPNFQLQDTSEKQSKKRLTKREAAILVMDDLHGSTSPNIAVRSKKFHKRISKPRYRTPKQEYLPQAYSKYKAKNFKSVLPVSSRKKRVPVTRRNPAKVKKNYGKLRRPLKKPYKRLPVKNPPYTEFHPLPRSPHSFAHHTPAEQAPMSFGEPPEDYQAIRGSYPDLLVDSYGDPLKTSVIVPNPIDTAESASNPQDNHNFEILDNMPDYTQWQVDPHLDSNIGSDNYQHFARPSKFEKHQNVNDFHINMDSDYSDLIRPLPLPHRNLRKVLSKHRLQSNVKNDADKVLVGGQYAEPPGRYISMLSPKEKTFFEDEPFGSNIRYTDAETSPAVSPYVNYKNSNMAFSPQNLNDAFSMDK